MANRRRGNVLVRLASLEERAVQAREEFRQRVVVYLPRKDGDRQPLGVYSQSGNVLMVLYDPTEPMPTLPEGW